MKVIKLSANSFNKQIKEFMKIISDKSKSFVLIVRSPHCGHCVSMAESWEKAKKKASKKRGLVVIEMSIDVAQHLINKHGNLLNIGKILDGITGVPEIRKFPKGPNAEHVSFDDSRTVENLEQFLTS